MNPQPAPPLTAAAPVPPARWLAQCRIGGLVWRLRQHQVPSPRSVCFRVTRTGGRMAGAIVHRVKTRPQAHVGTHRQVLFSGETQLLTQGTTKAPVRVAFLMSINCRKVRREKAPAAGFSSTGTYHNVSLCSSRNWDQRACHGVSGRGQVLGQRRLPWSVCTCTCSGPQSTSNHCFRASTMANNSCSRIEYRVSADCIFRDIKAIDRRCPSYF